MNTRLVELNDVFKGNVSITGVPLSLSLSLRNLLDVVKLNGVTLESLYGEKNSYKTVTDTSEFIFLIMSLT